MQGTEPMTKTLADVQPGDVKPGDRVIWLKTARGGYGYRFQYPATVVRVSGERATIKADHATTDRLRSVLIASLRVIVEQAKEQPCPPN
jgi:hypothetical protein